MPQVIAIITFCLMLYQLLSRRDIFVVEHNRRQEFEAEPLAGAAQPSGDVDAAVRRSHFEAVRKRLDDMIARAGKVEVNASAARAKANEVMAREQEAWQRVTRQLVGAADGEELKWEPVLVVRRNWAFLREIEAHLEEYVRLASPK